jgi:hypothetical protein
MKYTKKIQAYQEILHEMEKHEEFIKDDRQINIISNIKSRLVQLNTLDLFDIYITLDPFYSTDDWIRINEYARVGLYGKKVNRGISWEDEDKKPDNEWLYILTFPSGAYLFGKDYPHNLFDRFFDVLKSYNPKYIDSRNHALYFDHTTAKNIHEDFNNIFENYKQLYQEENKEKLKRIAKLEQELRQLRDNNE